jgi:hypothetical protein
MYPDPVVWSLRQRLSTGESLNWTLRSQMKLKKTGLPPTSVKVDVLPLSTSMLDGACTAVPAAVSACNVLCRQVLDHHGPRSALSEARVEILHQVLGGLVALRSTRSGWQKGRDGGTDPAPSLARKVAVTITSCQAVLCPRLEMECMCCGVGSRKIASLRFVPGTIRSLDSNIVIHQSSAICHNLTKPN